MTPLPASYLAQIPRIRLLCLALGFLAFLTPAFAASSAFDIPAQSASAALQLFVKQSGAQVVFNNDALKNVQTNEVKGELEPDSALAKLLAGTGFSAERDERGNFVVSKTDPKKRTGSVEGSLIAPRGSGKNTANVTVTVAETGEIATVDRRGHFEFSSLSPGRYNLVAVGEGFSRLRITDVVVEAGHSVILGAQEMPIVVKDGEVQVMQEVVVTASQVEQMEKYVVEDTNAKPPPFSDRDVDLPRGVDDVQPYYIFNSQTIDQSGETNVEDFLKDRLTMDTLAQSNSQAYASLLGTTGTVNLRGLGTGQTLILIDGRRTTDMTYLGNTVQPDVNGVPLSAIDRIKVLPSSASGIYGGSAMGGVVNIILKKGYTGGEIKYTYENTADTDAPIRTLDANYGFAAFGGKTHVMVYAHYEDGKPLVMQDRASLIERGVATVLKNDPSYFTLLSYDPFYGATPNIALYPSTYTPPGGTKFTDVNKSVLTLKNGVSLGSNITYIPPGTTANTDLSSALLANAGQYNYALASGTGEWGLQNEVGSVPRSKSLRATVRQQVTSHLEAFVEGSLDGNVSLSLYNPLGAAAQTISGAAPENPFQENVAVTIPSTLTVPQTENSVTRGLSAGLVASLPASWRAELDYTWSRNSFSYVQKSVDGSALETDLNNGTLDPFVDTVRYPLNLAPYEVNLAEEESSSLDDLAVRGSGPVGTLPGGRPTLAFALEHRKEGNAGGSYDIDYTVTTANSVQETYFGQSESTGSAYGEAEIPLVGTGNARPGVRTLDLQFAGRVEHYTVGTGTTYAAVNPAKPRKVTYSGPLLQTTTGYTSTNPTVGLKYEPVSGLILRASYAKAFLPPTYSDLLPNPTVSSPQTSGIYDPKTGTTYSGYTTTSGGNPDLKPQTSKDWDLGVIWEPEAKALKGLRLDLEFFQIKEFDMITSPPNAQFIVSNESEYPGRVTRDPTTALITQIDLSSINLYELETEGWDLSLDYKKKTPAGTFGLHALGSIEEHYKQQISLTLPMLEYVGYVAEGGPAKTKGNLVLTWQRGPFVLGWTATYFDSYKQYGAPGDPQYSQRGSSPPTAGLTAYTAAQGGPTVGSTVRHDVYGSWRLGGEGSGRRSRLSDGLTLSVGVRNVFNTLPPFDAYFAPYFYSPYGNLRLRDYWISVRRDF